MYNNTEGNDQVGHLAQKDALSVEQQINY